jgi:ribonuclease HII
MIEGDRRSSSVAAASILAKVTRDRLMCEAAELWPGYGFEHHKGYAAPEHLAALRELGPSPIHRRSFEPVRLALEGRFARDWFDRAWDDLEAAS